MDRRQFITAMGVLGAAAALPIPAFASTKKHNYKFGFQLFSVNQDMNRDPISTLKAVAAMGYEDFEIFGFNGDQGTFYGQKAAAFKTLLDDHNVTVSSGHFEFAPLLEKSDAALMRFVDQCIEGARTLNMKYITWPWLAPEQRSIENYKALCEKLNRMGERVNSAGLGFAYHNHGFEFEDQGGQNGYDIILKETDPALVKLQMDLFWVMHSSKHSPKELVKAQPGRYVMWHIKDMDKKTRDYTELGNGSIDYPSILPDPVAAGMEFYYLEQGGNFTHSALQSAADSARYFKQNLQHLF
ncbi:TIM barrel protein [Cellvibrio sp. UBA7661]|uniref:TIM barrel protein n=1 Tax=Cellvibrio sp. UBA7661 TaxID=1946311 RepID=UPI002F35D684